VRRVVAFVAILSVIAPLAAWGPWDKKLDPAAVKVMYQASEDAVRVERRAERDLEDAAASQRGGWNQSLTMVGERPQPTRGEEQGVITKRIDVALLEGQELLSRAQAPQPAVPADRPSA